MRVPVVAMVCLVLAAAFSKEARPDDEQLFTGLKRERVIETLALTVPASPIGVVGFMSVRSMDWPGHALRIRELRLAVYPTPDEAVQYTREFRRSISESGGPLPAGLELGQSHCAWGVGSTAGTILFRRRNLVVWFTWTGSQDEAVTLAQQIDQLIRDDRQVAPLGTFAQTPEIVSAGVPATLTASSTPGRTADGWPTGYERSYVTITPQFRGLGDLDKLRFVVLGSQDNGQTWGRLTQTTPEGKSQAKVYKIDTTERGGIPKLNEVQEDGRFLMEVPRKTGALKLKLIAGTEDNLIVTKEVQVTVVPAD